MYKEYEGRSLFSLIDMKSCVVFFVFFAGGTDWGSNYARAHRSFASDEAGVALLVEVVIVW